MSVKDSLDEYIKDAKNDAEREALAKEFFLSNARSFAAQIRELSDDELDAVAGGVTPPTIGNIYDCEDYKNVCQAIFKNDICQAYIC